MGADNTNLDLHCEGAIAYRNILADARIERKPNITLEILNGILANVETAHDNCNKI